jgi:predicted benzoate:H+ symporter BenE
VYIRSWTHFKAPHPSPRVVVVVVAGVGVAGVGGQSKDVHALTIAPHNPPKRGKD